MKKTKALCSKFICTVLVLYGSNHLHGQSSFNGHLGSVTATDWCGWNAASTIPFSIEHRGNQRINFSTNGFNRMFIDNGAVGITAGRIAMGNNLPANFAPQARLHLHHTGGGNTNLLFTNIVTGSTLNSGFEIGMTVTGEVYLV